MSGGWNGDISAIPEHVLYCPYTVVFCSWERGESVKGRVATGRKRENERERGEQRERERKREQRIGLMSTWRQSMTSARHSPTLAAVTWLRLDEQVMIENEWMHECPAPSGDIWDISASSLALGRHWHRWCGAVCPGLWSLGCTLLDRTTLRVHLIGQDYSQGALVWSGRIQRSIFPWRKAAHKHLVFLWLGSMAANTLEH